MGIAKRIGNQLRCYGSYALSLVGIVRVHHMPTFLSVEPASICQLRCPECPVGMHATKRDSRTPARMPMSLYREVLRQAGATVHTIQFYFQGEPLLNPALPDMVKAAVARGIYTIVSTNAQALDRTMARRLVASGLHRIIISMDGLTQATYEAYRQGGDVEQAKRAIRYLQEARQEANGKAGAEKKKDKKYPIIELQCLRLRSNEGEWQAFRQSYRALGADRLRFKTAQLYDYGEGNPLMPTDLHYARYEKGKDGKYILKRSLLRRLWQHITKVSPCYRLWAGCVLTTAGEVLPCCYDKSHQYAYGNIQNTTLRTLFGSTKANRFRKRIIRAKEHSLPAICRNCWH